MLKDGRKGRLSDETLSYYKRVRETIDGNFADVEDKDVFLENVFSQLSDEVLGVMSNHTCSSIIESLLWHAKPNQLEKLMTIISVDWETVCMDRFACYCVQTLVEIIGVKGLLNEDTDTPNSLSTLFTQLCIYLKTELGIVMQHVYASHILRATFEVLTGVHVAEEIIRSRFSRNYKNHATKKVDLSSIQDPPKSFRLIFDEISIQVSKMKKLDEHMKNALANPVLQTLLLIRSKLDESSTEDWCRQIIFTTHMFEAPSSSQEKQQLPELICHTVSSHFVEQLIAVSSPNLLEHIYKNYFSEILVMAANHPTANFVTQKLILNAPSATMFSKICKHLRKHTEDILASGHYGVINALIHASVKHHILQEKILKSILKGFHCYLPEERRAHAVQLISTLSTYETFFNELSEEENCQVDQTVIKDVTMHGSLILQSLLTLDNCHLITNSLSGLSLINWRTLCFSRCGSHIIESIFKSQTVSAQLKYSFLEKCSSLFVEMACDKVASHIIDTIWNNSSLKQRELLAEKLITSKDRIRGNRIGFFIYNNCGLETFAKSRSEWKQIQMKNNKKRKLDNCLSNTLKNNTKKVKKF